MGGHMHGIVATLVRLGRSRGLDASGGSGRAWGRRLRPKWGLLREFLCKGASMRNPRVRKGDVRTLHPSPMKGPAVANLKGQENVARFRRATATRKTCIHAQGTETDNKACCTHIMRHSSVKSDLFSITIQYVRPRVAQTLVGDFTSRSRQRLRELCVCANKLQYFHERVEHSSFDTRHATDIPVTACSLNPHVDTHC